MHFVNVVVVVDVDVVVDVIVDVVVDVHVDGFTIACGNATLVHRIGTRVAFIFRTLRG